MKASTSWRWLAKKRHFLFDGFLPENFTVILFHYDGNLDGWRDLEWSREAVHIVAHNQTKWWFAKRFLHPSVVSIYDYIFLWDEDLGVQNFHPVRYLEIVKSEGLEISQPALDPNSTGIHHRITIRRERKYSIGEFMMPEICGRNGSCIFKISMALCLEFDTERSCSWMGNGHETRLLCTGDRTKKVGVVDSEYIVHQSIQTLGGQSARKVSNIEQTVKSRTVDVRSEIRRQSTIELKKFKERWERAVKEDKKWVDPFPSTRKRKLRRERKWLYSEV
ncbi:UNVERIFIED_CONTAM: hypothetical protein Sangu_2359800 [Sesamum angustifolium]|uniref:Uncharacterized protein n=1 Tax=Sesamum angustifolium TaxID=2727405 RepID=A0AAW2KUF5_9LAMI